MTGRQQPSVLWAPTVKTLWRQWSRWAFNYQDISVKSSLSPTHVGLIWISLNFQSHQLLINLYKLPMYIITLSQLVLLSTKLSEILLDSKKLRKECHAFIWGDVLTFISHYSLCSRTSMGLANNFITQNCHWQFWFKRCPTLLVRISICRPLSLESWLVRTQQYVS